MRQVNESHDLSSLIMKINLGLGTAGLVYTLSEPFCTESGNDYCAIGPRNGVHPKRKMGAAVIGL